MKGRQNRVLVRASEVPSVELCHLVKCSAGDLVGQTSWKEFVRYQDVCLDLSYVALYRGHYAGVALLARRGLRFHLSVLAVRREYRSRGLGRLLLTQVIQELGHLPCTLDVLARNTLAVTLYRSHGFRTVGSSYFWYRPLPLRWNDVDHVVVYPLEPSIALDLTESADSAWSAQASSLRPRLPRLRAAVTLEQAEVKSVVLFHPGIREIVVLRAKLAELRHAYALLRQLHLLTPSASAIYLRWVQDHTTNSLLQAMGFRCYGEYNHLRLN